LRDDDHFFGGGIIRMPWSEIFCKPRYFQKKEVIVWMSGCQPDLVGGLPARHRTAIRQTGSLSAESAKLADFQIRFSAELNNERPGPVKS